MSFLTYLFNDEDDGYRVGDKVYVLYGDGSIEYKGTISFVRDDNDIGLGFQTPGFKVNVEGVGELPFCGADISDTPWCPKKKWWQIK